MSQIELAAYVQTHLDKNSIRVVLSGGAAVSFYVGDVYVSKDIDLIADWMPRAKQLVSTMEQIGFVVKNKYFTHPETEELIEILPGPLTVGEEQPTQVNEVILSTGKLRVLTAMDCIKDRLAAYIHWNDTQSLQQAVQIAQEHKVDLQDIHKWAVKEGGLKKFEEFLSQLEQ